jgi:uncharacterized protein YabN with tetrapyrrole methylase and pyrophosphatase domain
MFWTLLGKFLRKFAANQKFIKRFKHLENAIKKEGKDLMKMNLNEMNKYWNKSKKETV